jgi:predicted MFS family arabinose efflux permease
VFGIPVGTLISDMFGWRSAFAILAVVALAKALLLFIYLPVTSPKNAQVTLRSQFKILRSPLMQGISCCRSWCSAACSPLTPIWRTSSSAWPVSTAPWLAGA